MIVASVSYGKYNSRMEHKVISVEDLGWPLIKVSCSCGYWQQIRRLAYFERVWIEDHKDLILIRED